MNWSRAKTILIIMFLCTAVFQASVLYNSNQKSSKISPEIIASSVEILAANNISIDSAIIPEKNYSLSSVDAENAVWDYYEFAKLLIGNECEKKSDTEYSSNLGTVTFLGNSFKAVTKVPENVNTKNEILAQKSLKEVLEKLGINLKNSNSDIKKTDSGYELRYKNFIGDTPLFNSQISIMADKNGVELSGNWFNVTEKSGEVKLKSITAVLIELIKEDIEKPANITDISLGYIVPESDKFQKSASLVPVWQITLESGKTVTIDARSPQ